MKRPLPALLVLVLLAGGCRQTRPLDAAEGRAASPQAQRPAMAVVVDAEGPWQQLDAPDPESSVSVVRQRVREPLATEPAPAGAREPHALPVPRRRVTPPPPPSGTPLTISPEQRARERYLSNPTLIRAARITFYCPVAYYGEVQLFGADVSQPSAERRVAYGEARLLCRELTLEAEQITVVRRKAGETDVQLTAKGNVAYVTQQRGQVLQSQGLRLLLLSNEQISPLR